MIGESSKYFKKLIMLSIRRDDTKFLNFMHLSSTQGYTMHLAKSWFLLLVALVSFHLSLGYFDCEKYCSGDHTDPNFRPQECPSKCPNGPPEEDDLNTLVEGLRDKMEILSIMVITLLALVVLLLILFMINLATNRKLRKVLNKFYSKFRRKDPEDSVERDPGTPNREENDKIAKPKFPASYSPNASRVAPQLTSSIREHSPRETPYKARRTRMPSESTCPDDSQGDITPGYDNLALSTSTISFHSRPSSPSSPQDTRISSDNTRISIATLSTTVV